MHGFLEGGGGGGVLGGRAKAWRQCNHWTRLEVSGDRARPLTVRNRLRFAPRRQSQSFLCHQDAAVTFEKQSSLENGEPQFMLTGLKQSEKHSHMNEHRHSDCHTKTFKGKQ